MSTCPRTAITNHPLPQATFFVACLSLDCRRLANNRNGLCPCYTHRREEPDTKQQEAEGRRQEAEESSPSLSQRGFAGLARVSRSRSRSRSRIRNKKGRKRKSKNKKQDQLILL